MSTAAADHAVDQLLILLGKTPPPSGSAPPRPAPRPAAQGALVQRAEKYLAHTPGAVSGSGGHNHTFRIACKLVHPESAGGFGLHPDTALQLLEHWNQTCEPPWSADELQHKVDNAAAAPPQNGQHYSHHAAPWPPSGSAPRPAAAAEPWDWFDAWEAAEAPGKLPPVVIEGLLRRGEVCNIVGATKTAKSWFALGLLFSVAAGREWLGRRCERGRVALIDNELKAQVLRNRLARVAGAMQLDLQATMRDGFDVVSLRGQWRGILDTETELLRRYKPGDLTLLVLDAKYRFFGGDTDENSNGDQTEFHNIIDRLASQLDCAVCLVHHSTKGNQASKSVTDMGAGGGAQSRAVDCHLTLREHEVPENVVLQAVVRSFEPPPAQTIRFDYPVWSAVSGVSPVTKKERAPNKISPAEMRERILGAGLLDGGWQSTSRLARRCSTNPDNASFFTALQQLVADGIVERGDKKPNAHSPKICDCIRRIDQPEDADSAADQFKDAAADFT